jgi:hypothetical protein
MHAAQWFSMHKSRQRFNAQRKFAQGQKAFA